MNRFFIICERDAGLFSLIQQVIANLPRALNDKRIPIVYFAGNCCYWVPGGYQGKDNVWEYYFEPLLENFSSELIPDKVKTFAETGMSDGGVMGIAFNERFYLSSNFGDHSLLRNKCLVIPYEWQDPDPWLREVASKLINTFVHPRQHLLERVNYFANKQFQNKPIIGLHIRGTDSVSEAEPRLFRKNSLVIDRYIRRLEIEKKRLPKAKIFVATDSVSSLAAIKNVYGEDVLSSATILHSNGQAAGTGPTGALMPAYFANDPNVAVENGAEAVVDYLLLRRCDLLIHNGASLARAVLLSEPDMPHYNTHRKSWVVCLKTIPITPRAIRKTLQKWDERINRSKKVDFEKWIDFTNGL